MEFTRVTVAVVLVLSSISPPNAASTPPSSGGEGDAYIMLCIQNLMPSQPYLHSVNPPPPASWCVPLKQIVDMFKSLNLTKENALVLPKACGANADISLCKSSSGKTPPGSSTTPMTPPASSAGNGTTGDSAPSTARTSDSQVMNFTGVSFVSATLALFL